MSIKNDKGVVKVQGFVVRFPSTNLPISEAVGELAEISVSVSKLASYLTYEDVAVILKIKLDEAVKIINNLKL